ncbi:transcriptional corepressor SEUSS-like [Syzygium oleosum]|uniref:transcriptional corepressor SEUSS-like n=1 Tax=Syzygium oleosum TaxID=219896 RepID=UPI0011D19203|nr:transcriptional corepressor SEUSS-like [Syzygium oleosum]XP_030465279.1 transcriptional corepressor SEUSS-like [Syzygium oleosum]
MVPSGPSTPIGGAQSVSPSLLRSNSGMLGAQGNAVPSPMTFSNVVPPRAQISGLNVLGNMLNASSELGQSFGNGGQNPAVAASGSNLHGDINSAAESDPLSSIGNGMGFNTPSSTLVPSNIVNPGTSGPVPGKQFLNPPGNQLMPDYSLSQPQPQSFDQQNFQQASQQSMQQVSNQVNTSQPSQQQFQSTHGALAGVGPVKLEPQMGSDQLVQRLQQPMRSLRNPGPVKLEPQQIPNMRNLAPVKVEPQNSDMSLLHQQQQQQVLHLQRQSPQAAAQINLLNQQRLLLQQQQQQQLMKVIPQPRAQLPQQYQQQNLPLRSPARPAYEPGTCARRLTRFIYQQQRRPEDNNIEYWRKFVAEFFAPNAKKKWCVSMYGNGRQATGVFPQEAWQCEICNRKPGRGFEATFEVLPRLFKIKYESGTLEELLYVDMPREQENSSGQIVLDYAKAIQESVFEQLRVVRDGQLRIVFSPDLKICSWEFCARRHEELIPRRLLIPQVSQLSAAAQKYQVATQNASSNLSVSELQNNCNMFLSSARQLAKALEVPLVNDLGYTKRYVRCLQISEVVNSMKDLIDYSRETRTGPMESLVKFPRRTSLQSRGDNVPLQPEQQHQQRQTSAQTTSRDQNSVQASATQIPAHSGGVSVNNPVNAASSSASSSAIVGLLHQNSMNYRKQSPLANVGSPYRGAGGVHNPSPGSSSTAPPAQPNTSSYQPPTPSTPNNPMQGPHNAPPAISSEGDANDNQSCVQKILQNMISGQLNGSGGMVGVGSMGSDLKSVNGLSPTCANMGQNSTGGFVGNGPTSSNPGFGSSGYGTMVEGMGQGQSAMVSGLRSAMANGSLMNGRVGMMPMVRGQSINHQQDLSTQLLNGLGAANGFTDLQFDWKPSP